MAKIQFYRWLRYMREMRNSYARNTAEELLILQRLQLNCDPNNTPLRHYLEGYELWQWRIDALLYETEAIHVR